MQIFTSYFYQVRFFAPHEIPMSTAVFDPKWYHANNGQDFLFVDRRGVLNGGRATTLAPDSTCKDLCRGPQVCNDRINQCTFLRAYRAQLDKLNCDNVVKALEFFADSIREIRKLPLSPSIILLVHEVPDNPCSERRIIQEWFRDNGYSVTEWSKPPV